MLRRQILNSKFRKLSFIFAVFLTFSSLSAAAQHEPEEKTSSKFDPNETIMEHIADSHQWHVIGHTIIPLPVILYTDKGIETFSSSVFGHGEESYAGKYYSYKLFNDKIKVIDAKGEQDVASSKKVWDFSITKNVVSMWMSIIILIVVFLGMASTYTKRRGKAPKGLQSFLEPIIVFIRDDVAIPNIGAKYERYMTLLLTVFFFILINNLIGLIPFFPGGYNLTGNIAVTMTLAAIMLLVVNFNGNKYYWKHIFMPDIPKWLYPIMLPVELVGVISRPFALMIRLFANITAGHIVVLSLISLIFIFNTLWMAPVSVAFAVFIDVIELLVAFLQAYIFTMLSSLFIGMATEEHHH